MPVADARFCKTLLICPHRQTMTDLAPLLVAALPLAPIQKVNSFPERRELTSLLQSFDARLCFLDFTTAGAGGFSTLETLQTIAPEVMVVALLPASTPDLALRCLRAGATDFLVAPYTPDQVENVIEKVARRIPAAEANATPARIIAVVPAKGGCGATTVACNLAYHCRKAGAKRVLLADLDGLTGSVSFQLKLKSAYSFLDVIHHSGGLDADIWKQMVATVQGFDVLLAPESQVDPTAELYSASPVLDYPRFAYDVIVIDTGGVYGSWNLSIAKLADEVCLVASNEISDLNAVQRAIAYYEVNGVESSRIRVVINRFAEANGIARDGVGNVIDREVTQFVPADTEALESSLMDGKPVAAASVAGKSLAALASQLLEIDAGASRKKKSTGLLSSLFSRS